MLPDSTDYRPLTGEDRVWRADVGLHSEGTSLVTRCSTCWECRRRAVMAGDAPLSTVAPMLARAVEIERLERRRWVGVDPALSIAITVWKVDPITGVWSLERGA